MAKTLRVIDSFLFVEVGDTFDWSDDTNMYNFSRRQEYHKTDDSNSELRSSYESSFSISADYAKELIAEGYLEEATESKKPFTNIFDEIDRLIAKYTDELKNIEEDMADMPECLKVERTTVLNNILSVLSHLKDLKK